MDEEEKKEKGKEVEKKTGEIKEKRKRRMKKSRGREITKNNSGHERAACNLLSACNTPARGRKQRHISPEKC